MSEENVIVDIEGHWTSAEQELDLFMEGLDLEFARQYLQGLDRLIDPDAVVPDEDARQFLENVKSSVAFDRMMINFLKTIAEWPPADCRELTMNTKQLDWVRNVHQRYQNLKLYTGRRKDELGGRKAPTLYGVPITIDESVKEPRFW